MEKYIQGHTGKRIIKNKAEALYIAKNNYFGKKMRAYLCKAETGNVHWHVTKMSKGCFYSNMRKDIKKGGKNDYMA